MIHYTREKQETLKSKFNGVETIDKNYSQAYQDMFVLTMLEGKRDGTYLEVGACHPVLISNTYLLDSKFGWKGISIDINPSVKAGYDGNRNCNLIVQDALTIDYAKLMADNNMPNQIDYLQLDIEPQSNTLACLKRMPLNDYRFSVITYETDFYDPAFSREDSLKNREESREILLSHGYELIVGNVCNTSTTDPFEDWYVDPNVVSKELIELFKQSSEFDNVSEKAMIV